MKREPVVMIGVLALCVWAGLFFWPVNATALRLIYLASLALWVACLFMACLGRKGALVLAAMLVLASLACFLPAKDVNRLELSLLYVHELGEFQGTPYVWGGENGLGLDCSGLMRKSLQNACLRYALRHLDPGMARTALSIWWNDLSAKVIGQGQGMTMSLGRVESLESLPYNALRPGDMAVAPSGQHVLAYLGGGEWIQATQLYGMRVVVLPATDPECHWFHMPMNTVRWAMLE